MSCAYILILHPSLRNCFSLQPFFILRQDSVIIASGRCLYIHIPFCRVRCTYCNFFQYASSEKLIEDYFQALVIELKRKAALAWTQSYPFQAVYVGGGGWLTGIVGSVRCNISDRIGVITYVLCQLILQLKLPDLLLNYNYNNNDRDGKKYEIQS